jgi:putative ABC transport system substrate-binding protein
VIAAPAGAPAALAAKTATATIPILFVLAEDPVAFGLVSSLARPSGNMTGVNFLSGELAAKRLELLREMVPKARRVAVLVIPADATPTKITLQDLEPAARATGVQLQVLNANTANEIDAAFETIGHEQPDALFVAGTPFLNIRLVQLAQLTAFHRLPSTHTAREYAEVGGLMSYGSNIANSYREVGVYAGRILKGAKTVDLPVVQSSKFELVINARTAGMLGITVPPTLLATADDVIE